MNLHGIVSGAVGAVNPLIKLTIQVSSGYAVGPTGKQTPVYLKAVTAMGQVQPLTGGDLRHMDALNLQGEFKAIYINGRIDGLVRSENRGGDLVTLPDGTLYLVSQVLEDWPDWCKVAATLQNS